MTIADLKPGEKGTVAQVNGEGVLRLRLLDMGLTPGTVVMMQRRAPLGDPLQIRLRGYSLTLRRDDAEKILLQEMRP